MAGFTQSSYSGVGVVFRALIVAALLVSSLSACDDKKTRDLIDDHATTAEKAMQDMQHYKQEKSYNPLVVTDKVWTGGAALRMHRGYPLPSKYDTEHGVTLIASDPMDLNEIAAAVQAQTGIPVRINDIGNNMPGGGAGGFGVGGQAPKPQTMQVAYQGPLSGLLEKISGFFGVNWRYDGTTITVSKFETRVFVIEALPGTQSVSDGAEGDTGSSSSGGGSGSSGGGGGGSSGGSSGTGATQSTKFSIDFKYWDELDQVVTAMLGGTGTVVSSPSIGTITVTTTPDIMRSIADYVEKENKRLSKQIAISVEIYSVNLKEGTDFTVAFNTLLNRLKNFGGNFTSASAPTSISGFTGGGSLNLAILNPNVEQVIDPTTGAVLQTIKPIGQVKDIFTSLSGIGDTTKVAKFPLVTLNNKPTLRRIGEDRTYVASSTTGSTTTGSTSNLGTTITPGTVHQGFSVQLTPRLLDDGRILLQYSLSIIDIASITSFNSQSGACGTDGSCTSSGTGSSTIQLPDTLNRTFVQQSILRSGSTLLLGGAEEEDLAHSSQGVGDPYNYLLGGGTTSQRSHTMLFFAITPQTLEDTHPGEPG